MEYFNINPVSVPVDRVEYECRRLGLLISTSFKDYLDVSSELFVIKKLISDFPENEFQLCSTPPLPAKLEDSNNDDLTQYLYALYEQLTYLLGEKAMEPFQDELTMRLGNRGLKAVLDKYFKYFNLRAGVLPKRCFVGYGLTRIRHFTQNMAHAMMAITESSSSPAPVSLCRGWPQPPRSLSDLTDFEVANYLTRVTMFLLDGQSPDWTTTTTTTTTTNLSISYTFWPSWAEWKDPRNADVDTNWKILRHLFLKHDILEESLEQEAKGEWPPLPKALKEFDFIDVIAYIIIVVEHMTGEKPVLTEPIINKPQFWGENWGLPERLDQMEDPDWAKKWTQTQINELKTLITKYGPAEGARVDEAGYHRCYFHCFPFMGRFGDIDRIAQKRLHKCEPKYDKCKIPTVRWPAVDLAMRVVDEASLRGYLTEIVMCLSGSHLHWDRAYEQPDYWLKDVSWKHPFSGSLSLADVLKQIIHCLELFGPEYLGCTHECVYTGLTEDHVHGLRYIDMDHYANDILFEKVEFIRLCQLTAAHLAKLSSESYSSSMRQLKITKLVCRFCLWSREESMVKEKRILAFFRKHMRLSHLQSALCEICSKSFQSQTHLERHVQLFHLRTKMETCKICGKVITSEMARHMLLHEEKKFKCPECPKTFRHTANLNVHLKYHLKVRPFPCEVCGQGFSRKQNYQRHMAKHKQNDYHLPI